MNYFNTRISRKYPVIAHGVNVSCVLGTSSSFACKNEPLTPSLWFVVGSCGAAVHAVEVEWAVDGNLGVGFGKTARDRN